MDIDILTPHFQQPDYLQCCIKSVRAQTEANPEPAFNITHHIQDGGGAYEDLLRDTSCTFGPNSKYTLQLHQEKDDGMYDALNHAFSHTQGDIIGHLNCDEQYFPGTLAKVAKIFLDNPKVMVLSGSVVITQPDGSYLCSRVPIPPGYFHTAVCHLSLFTASTFYRRSLIQELGTYFDPSYRAAGDADLLFRMLKHGIRVHTVRDYFSVFIETGENLALSTTAKADRKRRLSEASALIRSLQPLISAHHQFRKWVHGCYFLKPFSYPFITTQLTRIEIPVEKPSAVWTSRRRLKK